MFAIFHYLYDDILYRSHHGFIRRRPETCPKYFDGVGLIESYPCFPSSAFRRSQDWRPKKQHLLDCQRFETHSRLRRGWARPLHRKPGRRTHCNPLGQGHDLHRGSLRFEQNSGAPTSPRLPVIVRDLGSTRHAQSSQNDHEGQRSARSTWTRNAGKSPSWSSLTSDVSWWQLRFFIWIRVLIRRQQLFIWRLIFLKILHFSFMPFVMQKML